MGRKDKKNPNPALKAKKEAKAEKAVQKRLRKEGGLILTEDGGEEQQQKQDFDSIISSFTKLDVGHPVIEHVSGFPTPRANFSLTVLPNNNNDILMFGGEYFNGAENVVYDDLFQWSPEVKSSADRCSSSSSSDDDDSNRGNHNCLAGKGKRGEWRHICSPSPKPKPRCAHSAVLYNGDVYVFGGELATLDQFHHYRDFWRYSPKTHLWEQVEPRTPGPSARSGHRCIVWRHYMILFGGFYEALRETPRWFNDLWVYDFFENLWTEYKYSKLTSMPDARSGFIFGLHTPTDTAFIYGGFSKVKNPGDIAEGKIHTDCWTLNLKPILSSGGIPSWNRISRKGEFPSARSSMSGVVHKHRLIVCGGVFDEERDHHVVSSLFYDDMFAMDMEKRRWFKLTMKKTTEVRKSRRKVKERGGDEILVGANVSRSAGEEEDSDDEEDANPQGEGEVKSSGWGLDELKAHVFAVDNGNGTILNNKVQDEPCDEESINKRPAAQQMISSGDDTNAQAMEFASSSANTITSTSRSIAPLPRIKPALVIRNNTLYLYGGLLEVGAREVTLDDMWSLDLQKRERWVCIYEGSMNQHAWKGEESDGESNFSSSVNDDGNISDDEDDEESLQEEAKESLSGIDSRTKLPQRLKKDARRKESEFQNSEIDRLKSELEQNGFECTPLVNESLAEFYARTSKFWTHEASTKVMVHTGETADDALVAEKEMKKIGFDLARERFLVVKPTVERIREMSLQLETESKVKKKETIAHSMKQDRKHRAK
jgi:hypothetical protein